MKNFIKNTSVFGAMFTIAMAIAPVAAYAQWDGNIGYSSYSLPSAGYTDYSSPSAGYTDYTAPSAGYTNYSSPSAGYTDYSSPSAGYTNYTSPSAGYTDYSYSNPGYTSYTTPTYTPSYSYSPTYSPSYGFATAPSIIGTSPSYGVQYAPGYSYGSGYYGSGYAAPISSGPIYGVASTPAAPSVNTNTNVNAPTFTVTNTPTNTNTATASVAPITNTNTASTGAITNNFSPVINVGAQPLAQATLPTPSCSIFASNAYQSGYYNQPITLTWSSMNATSAYISPDVGSVSAQGSQMVYPQGYTTYTMTVYGPGGSATCEATANYAVAAAAPVYTAPVPAPVPVYTVPAPVAPSVTLTQIPYTGFDFGTVGNTVYWTAFLALAAAAAYLLVYFIPRSRFVFAAVGARESAHDSVDEASTEEAMEVFKSSLISSKIPSVLDESEYGSALPRSSTENYRVTTDSMIVDTSSGAPRIVISRE